MKKCQVLDFKNLITIIIPVYNVELFLPICLDSIINQTYKNIEVILVDDGSTDGSSTICDSYAKKDKRIRVIHKKNEGVSIARNTGIYNSTGSFISFIDSDDYIDESYFENLINNYKNYELQCSNYVIVKKNKKDIVNSQQKEYSKDDYLKELIAQNIKGTCWGKIFKSEVVKKIEFDKNTYYLEDTLFLVRYILESNINKIKYCNTYYFYNNENETSITKNKKINVLETIKVILYSFDKMDELTNNKYCSLSNNQRVEAICLKFKYISTKKELINIVNNIKLPSYRGFKYLFFVIIYNLRCINLMFFHLKIRSFLKKIRNYLFNKR